MTDEEFKERVVGIAVDLERTLRAHTDSLPERDGGQVAYTGVCVAMGFETLRALRAGGVEPDEGTLAGAIAAVPFDAIAEMVLQVRPGGR